jgi:putative copper export protein
MRVVYLLSVWLHILAATTWTGGMAFLVFVVVPWLRRGDRARAAAVLRETGSRFRIVGWSCFAVLAATGTFNLWFRGVHAADIVRADWLRTPFGQALAAKLSAFALVLAVSAVHDFAVGPRAARAAEREPGSPRAERLRRAASRLGRANALLALIAIAAAVVIVRGGP